MFDFRNLSVQIFNRPVPFKSLALAFLLLSAFAFLPTAAFAQKEKIITKKIAFEKGKTSTVVKSAAQPYTNYAYTFSAKKGQTLRVNVSSRDKNVYLTVFEPGALEPEMSPDEGDVSNWSGKLKTSGTYKIMVFSKSDAGASPFTLNVSIK